MKFISHMALIFLVGSSILGASEPNSGELKALNEYSQLPENQTPQCPGCRVSYVQGWEAGRTLAEELGLIDEVKSPNVVDESAFRKTVEPVINLSAKYEADHEHDAADGIEQSIDLLYKIWLKSHGMEFPPKLERALTY